MISLYTIPLSDRDTPDLYLIYRPLRQLAFLGNRAMADVARAVADGRAAHALAARPEVKRFLSRIGFLQPDPPVPQTDEAFRPTTAVLLMTNTCQLRCAYCYAAAGLSPRARLSPELGMAAIDHVHVHAVEQGLQYFEVAFHGGGEPTSNWRTLQACTRYARQKSLPARITLTSNGVWSRRQRDWIISELDGATISMDGAPETQNAQRPLLSGGGSADYVLRTIAALDASGFEYGIRMTAVEPWDTLPSDVAFICDNTNCATVQVEPAFKLSPGGHGDGSAAQYLAFATAFKRAFELALKHDRRLYYSGARPAQVTATFCLAPFHALIVGPGGRVVSCYEVVDSAHPLAAISTMGEFNADGLFLDGARREALHRKLAARRAGCQDCFCYYTCAGDCYVRTWRVDEDTGHFDYGARCDLNRDLTQYLLLQAISGAGGVWAGVQSGWARTAPQEEARLPT